jgi:hypothetical protein
MRMAIKSKSTLVLILAILAIGAAAKSPAAANAHFFGGVTKDFDDGYQILFVPSPGTPNAGDDSTTLNFSILKDGINADNIYASFTIKEKDSGKVEEQLPYKLYEFSDISIPYKFPKVANYVVTVETRINGDPKYQANPLIADFDVRAKDPSDFLSDNPAFVGLLGVGVAILAIACVLYVKKRVLKKQIRAG